MKPVVAALIGGIAMTIAATGSPALGQQIPCTEQDPTEHLSSYGERLIAYGTTEGGSVLLRVFGKPGGTWTIIVTQASPPLHCLIAAGEGFDMVPPGDKQKPRGTSVRYDSP